MRLAPVVAASLSFALLAPAAPWIRAQPVPSPPEKPPARRARSSTRTLSATFLALDGAANKVRLALEGGTSATALLNTESSYQKNGKAARVSDFAAGEKLTARLLFKPGGEIWLRNLWDAASYAAYTKERREVCAGVVARNTGKLLRVQRGDGSTLDLRVTDKTMVRKGGALASIETFAVGASVAVKPRGLPSGDLMAAIVADTPADIATAVLDGQVNWEGTLAEVNAERGALVLRRGDGASRPIAVAPTARLRRGRATLTLRDLVPGTPVKVHLLRGADANGLRTADAVSVVQPAAAAAAAAK